MTLNDFFNFLSGHPVYVVGFMVAIPILGAINGILADDRSPENPWRYIYMVLIYLISVPGIFAVTLLIYSFLFENRSVYDIDLVTQILPIISMFVTILVIKRYIDLDDVPGFGKLTGLIMMISVILILLWVLQKTRIIVFSYLPFYYVLLIVIGLIFIFRFGMRRIFK